MSNRLIDSKVSMNSSATNSISTTLTPTPTLFATLGLNAINAGPNLEVQFTVTATVSSIASSPITIIVQRVVGGVPTTIYSVTTDSGDNSTDLFTFNGVDVQPPATFLIYQALISAPTPPTPALTPIRVGPESMIAAAYSD